MPHYMVCLTTDNLDDFVGQRGCGYWRASANSIERCDYLICTKNKNGARTRWDTPDDKHRDAFLILELNHEKYIESGDRKIITFDRYAHVEPGTNIQWGGQSPIGYYTQDQLAYEVGTDSKLISLDFEWKKFSDLSVVDKSEELKLSIKDAKRALARFYDIDVACIKVTFNV
ncbi:hypothetical protein [Vibrio sp. 10N.261.46.A3]|uniref:hypothetical protein n=1 Tax=Vibrio sp. 10N.261.46.A3 TaxID=3229658 RepID=UPI00354C859B